MFSELGITLSIIGLVFIVLVWVVLGVLPRTLNSRSLERVGLPRVQSAAQLLSRN